MFILILTIVLSLGVGIWVGLGHPGWSGRVDRVVPPGRARRLPHNYVHWLRIKR
ncbi:MAG: hypothetical protein L0271_15185 [Gemmatimonadetes bacterium]|nr:hypothetical protein [Gemmatimonadota bacterium]